jgi:release factor glutamine methyltransferase
MSAVTHHHGVNLLKGLAAIPRLRCLRLAIAGIHFKVDAISLVHDHIWDNTSLVLRKAIGRYLMDGHDVLDLGTGHIGLLAIYCAKIRRVRVLGIDVNPEFIENAKIVARASQTEAIEFRQSDWFDNVDGHFDLIFGNVPYIPTEIGDANLYSHDHPEIWDGGFDGLNPARTVIRQVPQYLNDHGVLLLGLDAAFVSDLALTKLVENSRELELQKVIRSWISSSEVFVIGPRRYLH